MKLITVLCVSLLLVSCGSKQRNEFIDSARGEWRTGCQNFGVDSDYAQTTLTVRETSFDFSNSFYEDPRCTKMSARYYSAGTLAKHERLIRGDNVFAEIDYVIEQVTVDLLSQSKVEEFNTNAICGRTDWQLNVNVDVSNCVDILGSNVPRTEYDVYTTGNKTDASGSSQNVLYAGMIRGQSEDMRPSSPDYVNPYWQIRSGADVNEESTASLP